MDKDANRFRVLLAEDDPVSREFLHEAIRACGAAVTDCADGDAALALARSQAWQLLILDHHLPGSNGDAVLAALRADPGAASHAAPAIATSAEAEANRALLLRAGFAEVLSKPMRIETLQAALHRHGLRADPALDDAAALRACGSADALARLRRLFADEELPRIADELARAEGDPRALGPGLHRLRASCGFCGAAALARASEALQRALAGDDVAQVQSALEAFRNALAATRAALHGDRQTHA